ncbi:DNA-binding transcriptional response regulator, NtrC family, contains REC, AAA-type ATPase, and a Fis-type DNA-binding domains [Desulfonatronum thiosulfatophilum]|uniref:DNA-binding transcriptional response regulator, NtrC family, contains REC, AAA-type ATPase, and a Fis-type DNA-binding domains n=1 Tax=Desulfonatronum thiosulfatophilum TaxID=617002 RepID=A0A1G6EQV1_9BACT|nr:sigma-54 dependent transcriptional regulator [Desulfonatronum thiosulfatophilum]SDB59807.1 DNA-binding transcriptional response regulator, NtrC family, contains REC, AAA-type ATPase, and a Fis-type DNA-binding domains [Desulfonatronum thiosulfatophilum]
MPVPSILFLAPTSVVTPLFQPIKRAGLDVGMAETIPGALKFIQRQQPILIFCRDRLTGFQAEDLLSAIHQSNIPAPPVIIFTDKGSAEDARKFMELGARDYWLEPLLWDKVRALLTATADPQPKEPPRQPVADVGEESAKKAIIGRHPTMQRALALAGQVARSKATILISGESGTGKELFARFLHNSSDRSAHPFIAVNCAALPEHLLESELFGHEKGAFTGAITRKLGKFELAHGGTLLLDEISEMDMGLQAKLLRVLQEGEIDRVGGSEIIPVDVRVLATTNRDLAASVQAKEFRQDLYYRLNVIPLRLPPLRERGEDIQLLTDFFVSRFARMYSLGAIVVSPEARQWLKDHDWPGNVRELQNLMERATLLCGGSPIEPRHFLLDESGDWQGEGMIATASSTGLERFPHQPGEEDQPDETEITPGDYSHQEATTLDISDDQRPILPLHEVERHLIFKSLDYTAGNRTKAAVLLGVSVRTLRNKLNEYRQMGLEVP